MDSEWSCGFERMSVCSSSERLIMSTFQKYIFNPQEQCKMTAKLHYGWTQLVPSWPGLNECQQGPWMVGAVVRGRLQGCCITGRKDVRAVETWTETEGFKRERLISGMFRRISCKLQCISDWLGRRGGCHK